MAHRDRTVPERTRLADRWWLLAYEGDPLRPLLGPAPLSLGCAGALLAELLVNRSITVGATVQARHREEDGETLGARLHAAIAAEPEHDLRTWVQYLAVHGEDKIRARLILADQLTHSSATAGLLRPVRYPVWHAATDEGLRVQHELQAALARPGPVLGGSGIITVPADMGLATLAGLAETTQLLAPVAGSGHSGLVQHWCARLPSPLAHLLQTVAALLAQSVTR